MNSASIEAIIKSHPFVKTMSPEHLELLSQHARAAEYAPDQIIFREGEPANRLFLIEDGSVALECRCSPDCSTKVETVGIGEAFGWSWLFPPFSWHLQARAVEPTRVIVLDGGHLLATAEENPKFGYELMKRVAKLAIHRLERRMKRHEKNDLQFA